ncbi:FAD-dependent oxidoreductase [Bacillus sp. CGMCC 1.16607]|uniref:FAD-binding oxidoreductase n=1 Tax=Bacillus sp. CGMCC 1.16607 TaxID=3351842 RepID=UPI00362C0CD6
MRKYKIWAILIYFTCFFVSIIAYILLPIYVEDAGKLLPTAMKEIKPATSESSLEKWVKSTNLHKEKVTLAGMQHTQGGHTLYPGATMIDMKSFNNILDYRPDQQRITVQSGITWERIQQKINRDGLALKVTQSQAIFTVGGSLSANIHGRDIRFGSLYDTVESFRLLTPLGEVIEVSRTKNSQWFPYVIGGYGLFGIILDVTLILTKDELYQIETKTMTVQDYPTYFLEKVKNNELVRMHFARISVAPDTFFNDMYVMNYNLVENQGKRTQYSRLKGEPIIALPKAILGLSRYSDYGKNLFWETQKKYLYKKHGSFITRNNVMRSDSEFMEYEHPDRTEVLSELFIPIHEFPGLISDLKTIVNNENLNLLNITIRYVEKDKQAVLSYAKEDMFGLVLLINQGNSSEDINKTKKIVQQMIDTTLSYRGSYYLPYYPYASKEQLRESYPNIQKFFKKKKELDPNEVFVNLFYEEYK